MTLLDIELGATAEPEFFASDEDVYATGLMFLAERFQLLLQAADDVGVIVVDSRFREEDARLRRFFADLTKAGSPYSRLDRIVEGLPRPEPLLDRAPVRRSRLRDHGRGGAGRRPCARLPEDAPASLCDASRDGRARRRRHQTLPRAGIAST